MRISNGCTKILGAALSVLLLASSSLYAGTYAFDTLLVSSKGTNQVLQYNLETGAYLGVFGDADNATLGGNLLSEPTGMDIGPDGNVYVAYRDGIESPATTGGILRFKPDGTFVDVFSTALSNIQDLDFGPDDNLYAGQFSGGACPISCILGPNSATPGILDPSFTKLGANNGVEPYFDPETQSNCYFRSISGFGGEVRLSDANGTTLAILDGPFTTNTGEGPAGLEFGPDGYLYCVTNGGAESIYRFDVSTIDYTGGTGTGTFTTVATDASLSIPLGIAFDTDGNILVANYDDCIEKYNVTDGTYMGEKIATGLGGLTDPHFGLTVLPAAAANVPEPGTIALLLSGLVGFFLIRKRG